MLEIFIVLNQKDAEKGQEKDAKFFLFFWGKKEIPWVASQEALVLGSELDPYFRRTMWARWREVGQVKWQMAVQPTPPYARRRASASPKEAGQ